MFAKRHNLKIGTIADLIRYRLRNERSVERISEQTVQTELGEFRLYAYEDRVNQDVHLALARGRLDGSGGAARARARSRHAARSPRRSRQRARLDAARRHERIAQAGNGVVVILRDHESPRDLADAVRRWSSAVCSHAATMRLQRGCCSGRSAEPQQEVREVLRTYGVGAQILKDLGVRRMRVLSAPKQMHGISAFDLEIEGYVGEEG